MQLIGQKNNLDIIKNWKTMPQFLMIQGDSHTGKTYLTLYLCAKFGLHYVKVDNSIKSVRNLLKRMVEDSQTVYHFKNFDSASIQAKNALLKITEEPIPGNYIVITGSTQLKTLESRAIRLSMSPYSKQETISYMQQYYNKTILDKLYIAGFNTPAKCFIYKDYEHIESLLHYVFDIYSKLTYLSMDEVIVMLPRFEARYDDKIDPCLLFLNMLINIIEYNLKNDSKPVYSYYNILNILIQGKSSLVKEPTLNRKFLLYRIFYNIYLLRGIG